jgi:hypothetical protein
VARRSGRLRGSNRTTAPPGRCAGLFSRSFVGGGCGSGEAALESWKIRTRPVAKPRAGLRRSTCSPPHVPTAGPTYCAKRGGLPVLQTVDFFAVREDFSLHGWPVASAAGDTNGRSIRVPHG